MDEKYRIYELTDEQKRLLETPLSETGSKEQAAEKLRLEANLARLDGYLKGRDVEAVFPSGGKGSNRDFSKFGDKEDKL